jgi:hypothetical protein
MYYPFNSRRLKVILARCFSKQTACIEHIQIANPKSRLVLPNLVIDDQRFLVNSTEKKKTTKKPCGYRRVWQKLLNWLE